TSDQQPHHQWPKRVYFIFSVRSTANLDVETAEPFRLSVTTHQPRHGPHCKRAGRSSHLLRIAPHLASPPIEPGASHDPGWGSKRLLGQRNIDSSHPASSTDRLGEAVLAAEADGSQHVTSLIGWVALQIYFRRLFTQLALLMERVD